MIDIKNRWCITVNGLQKYIVMVLYIIVVGWIKKPLGNILEQSWEEVWNGDVVKRISSKYD